jgi:hypothetical protein
MLSGQRDCDEVMDPTTSSFWAIVSRPREAVKPRDVVSNEGQMRTQSPDKADDVVYMDGLVSEDSGPAVHL